MDKKMTTLQLRIPQSMRDELGEICRANALNQSEIVRRLIAAWIEKKKKDYDKNRVNGYQEEL